MIEEYFAKNSGIVITLIKYPEYTSRILNSNTIEKMLQITPINTLGKPTRKMKLGELRKVKRQLVTMIGLRCEYCFKNFDMRDLTVDHIYYRYGGGANRIDNLALSCERCNKRKGSSGIVWCLINKSESPWGITK